MLTYSEIEELSVYHYQNFLDVSKGTILADIKKVRHQLATENIALSYERKRGFYLEGDEFRIRRFGKIGLPASYNKSRAPSLYFAGSVSIK